MPTITNDGLNFVSDIVVDLSTELDLRYETGDLVAIRPSINILTNAASILEINNHPVPEAYLHILRRYREAVGSQA